MPSSRICHLTVHRLSTKLAAFNNTLRQQLVKVAAMKQIQLVTIFGDFHPSVAKVLIGIVGRTMSRVCHSSSVETIYG